MSCGFPRLAFRSAKRITSGHGPPKNRIRPGFGPIRSAFDRLVPLLGPFRVRLGSVLGAFWVRVEPVSVMSGLSGSEKSIGFTIRFGHGAV